MHHRFVIGCLYLWIIGATADDFAWDSSYAEPAGDGGMASAQYPHSYVYPGAANPKKDTGTHALEPAAPEPAPAPVAPPPSPTHQSEVALPPEPTEGPVVLPVRPTASVETTAPTTHPSTPPPTTLSPLDSPDHFVRITMQVVNPLGVDRNLASFRCYLSQPDVGRSTLSTGRYSQTRDDVVRSLGESPTPPPAERLRGHAVAVDLTSSGLAGFGSFYCQGAQGGKDTTTVVGIFLTSDPKIIPAAGRFTKTVSLGDVDVTMAMALRHPADALTNHIQWRKDGSPVIQAMQGLDTFTFREPITEADGGVYECYYANERNQARHGLMRLIVKTCPVGRWNPPRCTGVCDACYNGGICDHLTGRCICPPGFSGENCEQACGPNRYGVSCEYRCASSPDERQSCRGRQFCLPDPYGCSCNTGFKGLECYTECDAGRYGAGCLQVCHCASGQCDRFTGQCLGSPSGCSRGWSAFNCQVPATCRRGYFGSTCLEKCHCQGGVACTKETGRCPDRRCAPGFAVYGNNQHCSECRPGTYGVGCMQPCACQAEACHAETGECDGRCFAQYIAPTCRAGITGMTASRVNSGQTSQVNCTLTTSSASPASSLPSATSVFLYRVSGGQTQMGVFPLGGNTRQAGGSKMTVRFGVERIRTNEVLRCAVVDRDGTITARSEIVANAYALPVQSTPPLVTATTATSLTIRWTPWAPGATGVAGPAGASYGDAPLIGYIVLYRRSGSPTWSRGQRVAAGRVSVMQRGLEPHTSYDVSVAAIRPGPGGEGPPSPWATGRTRCFVPTQPGPLTASTDVTAPRQIALSWQVPSPSVTRCPSGLVGFNVYFREVDSATSESGTHRLFSPTVTSHNVTGLHVYTKYLFSMSLLNGAGEGERSEEIEVYSPEELPPAPIKLTVLKSSTESALLAWETPKPFNVNGKIRFYELQYSSFNDEQHFLESETIRIDDLSNEMTYHVTPLNENLTYHFEVRTVNGVGRSEWSDAVTVSTVDILAALQTHGASLHGPTRIGLSIMGVFVGLLLLAGVSVGAARVRRRLRAQKKDELSTLRETVAFSHPTVCIGVSCELKENASIEMIDQKDEHYYTATIEKTNRKNKFQQDITQALKPAIAPKPKIALKPKIAIKKTTTTPPPNMMTNNEDDHRYEYIDTRRQFPVMRFALLANSDETVIHSYPVLDT